MTTEYKTCIQCGNSFIAGSMWLTYKCSVCVQTEAIEKQARNDQYAKQAEAMLLRAEEIRRTNALIEQAELTRSAIERQTKVIAESAISVNAAYEKGYEYLDNVWTDNNENSLMLALNEEGNIYYKWNNPYLTDRLNEQFKKGLRARIAEFESVDPACLVIAAKQAGIQNAEGVLDSTFVLDPELYVVDRRITTNYFYSEFESSLNEDTGEIMMTWQKPFQTEEYNDAYAEGVQEVYDEVNTEELKRQRREIVANNNRQRMKRQLSIISGWLLAVGAVLYVVYEYSGLIK